MNKLTTKLIVNFIITVLISLAVAMLITFQLIPHHISSEVKKGVDKVAEQVENQQLTETDLEKQISDFSFLTLHYISLEQVQQSTDFSSSSKKQLLEGHIITSEKFDRTYRYVYPVIINGQQQYLQILLDQTMYKDVLNRAFILLSIITLFFGIMINIFTSIQIVRPIKQLTQLTKQFASGNFTFKKSKNPTIEIDQLYTSFEKMSTDLDKTLKSQKDFVSNISHEFQTPLTSIGGFAKALQQKEMTRDKQHQYLKIIENESARLSLLSRNVLKLSSLQNNTHELEMSQFDLAEQIRAVIISLEPHWQEKTIHIDFKASKQLIFADKMLLHQVWYNLINNAIAFSPSASTISIQLQKQQSIYTISIVDQGPGIAEDELARIKEPFYKAKTLKSSGNGLGLSIVENIVSKHLGSFIIENNDPGLKITVHFPTLK